MWTPLPATVPNRSPQLTPATGWKSLLAALALGGLSVLPAQAQLNYPVSGFSNLVTAYNTIAGDPLTTNIAIASGTTDNGRSGTLAAAQPVETIGFPFSYNGQPFTQFILYTNGFIRLGNAGVSSFAITVPSYNGQSVVFDGVKIPPLTADDTFGANTNSAFTNVIAPFNHDLVVGLAPLPVGATHFMKNVSGAPGSQVLTIEWYDMADKQETDGTNIQTPPQFTSFSFQLKLYEATGRIEFVYDAMVASANVTQYQTAQIGLRALNTHKPQSVVVQKLEAQPWSAANVIDAPFGGVGRNFDLPDGFEFNNTTLATAGRTFRFNPVTANTNNASIDIYSQGKIAVGVDFRVQARINNETPVTTVAPITAQLNVTGPGGFTFTDTQVVPAGLVPHTSPRRVTGARVVTFLPFNPPALGNYVQTVTITSSDDLASDNSKAYTSQATSNTLSYASAQAPDGGVGFNAPNTGIILGKFFSDAADVVNFVQADFDGTTAGAAYKAVVYSATGLGAPGVSLGESTVQVAPAVAGTVTIPVPNIPVPAGAFFVGIEQTTTNNIGVQYEAEELLRPTTFYVKFGAGAFGDASLGNNPFRFSIGVLFQRPATAPAICVTYLNPADMAIDQPLSGTIQFSGNPGVGGANTPDSYLVYLSTNQSAVQNELTSVRVDSTTANTSNYSGLSTSTVYYYKVVARNFLGKATGCAVRRFTTVPPPPANNDCANATNLTIKLFGGCGGGTPGTTTAATEEVGSTDPVCSIGVNNDVWYKFTSSASDYVANINLTRVGASQVGLLIYEGSCAGTPFGCTANLNGDITLIMDPSTTYYLRVFTNTNSQTAGTFRICVSQRPDLIVVANQNIPSDAFNRVEIVSGTGTLTGPLQANKVIVRDGATLLTNTSPIQGGSVTVLAGGTIGIGSSNGIAAAPATTGSLQVDVLNLSNDANYIYTNQSAGFTGAGLPGTVRSLTTSQTGSGDLTISNALSIRRMLTINNGSLDVSPATLTLLSDANFTAMVVNAGSGVVTGSAIVQRYLARNLNTSFGYRHIASPVGGTTLADLTAPNYSPIANPAYNDPMTRATLTLVNFPNVFFFSEPIAAAAGSFVEGYQSPATTGLTMAPMRGFSLYTRPTTFDFNGTLNNGLLARTITNNGSTDFGSGWNLVGNGYPSPIDWDLVTIPAGMSSSVSVFRSTGPNQAGNYAQYTNGVGPVGVERIAMAQGFFVEAVNPSVSFQLTNAARVTTYANPALNRRTETRPLVELALTQQGQDATQADRAYVYFEEGATAAGRDLRYDARKMGPTGTTPLLATRAEGLQMAINGLPEMTGADVVMPLVAQVTVTGTYVLNAEQVINFPANTQVLLEDGLTGTTQDLTQNPIYTFSATAGNTAPRFTLHFRGAGVTGVNHDLALNNQLAVYPNPVSGQPLRVELNGLNTERSVSIRLVNTLGQVVTQQVVKVANAAIATELNVDQIARGIYTLQVQTGGRTATRQVVVQ